ncbi:reverse transcriptase, partial [Candidatus Parcubacteria bacterium]|nr:reverse transcriptase [Candidatus Parcubacteria bacterium]
AKVEKKIKKLPNTEVVDLWLQRLTLKFDSEKKYQCRLNKKVINESQEIWNSDWLSDTLKTILNEIEIVNKKEIEEMDEYPNLNDVSLFESKTNYYN